MATASRCVTSTILRDTKSDGKNSNVSTRYVSNRRHRCMRPSLIDKQRVEAAQKIQIHEKDEDGRQLPQHHYFATGGASTHYLRTEPHLDCDCGDWVWRGGDKLCKHLIAALLHEERPELMAIVYGITFNGEIEQD